MTSFTLSLYCSEGALKHAHQTKCALSDEKTKHKNLNCEFNYINFQTMVVTLTIICMISGNLLK